MAAQLNKMIPVAQRIFAKNFKSARLAAGLRQQDVQRITGLSQPYLSDLERFRVGIGIDTMAILAQAVQVPLFHLLQPEFFKTYDLKDDSIWQLYQQFIDNSQNVPYERKLFARRLQESREALQLTRTDMAQLTGMAQDFLRSVEREEVDISINSAIKLVQAVGKPLYQLLMPKALESPDLF